MLDRKALEELFDYTDFTWAVFGKSINALPPAQFTQPVPGSGWPALRNVLFHIAAAWDDFLYNRFNMEAEMVESSEIQSWQQLDGIRATLRGLLRRMLDESSDEALRTEVASDAGGVTMTSGELISHLLLHDLRHHGDITTLLYQLGAQPTLSDYAAYRWFKNRKASP